MGCPAVFQYRASTLIRLINKIYTSPNPGQLYICCGLFLLPVLCLHLFCLCFEWHHFFILTAAVLPCEFCEELVDVDFLIEHQVKSAVCKLYLLTVNGHILAFSMNDIHVPSSCICIYNIYSTYFYFAKTFLYIKRRKITTL